jgi:DNA-binding protein H-NS
VKAKNRTIKDIQKGNRELLQKNTRLETRVKELNDELIRTYRNHDFKTDLLDDACTRLQHTQDELTTAQSYVHHLETELHERDEQLEMSQAQTTELQNAVEHLQELIPQEPEEPEEDLKEIDGEGPEKATRGGEWKPIKIPRWNLSYVPNLTRRTSLLARSGQHSYRHHLGVKRVLSTHPITYPCSSKNDLSLA